MMLSIVTNESTKDDIFSIVILEENQLKALGKIIKRPNFEDILNKAIDAIRLEKERDSDWEHKYKIGTYIEDKIRLKLGTELSEKINIDKGKKLEAEDIQGGQDIVISFNGDPLYYIEVKSRWDSRSSVSMSKLQLEKASKNIEIYSLISVDVTKYNGEGDRYQLSEAEIIPLIKVLNGLGSEIFPLIENNLIAESDVSSAVKLIDFRGIINQDTIKNGFEFDFFVDDLVASLTEKVNALIGM
ncbi:hypothetical protein PQ469_24375 [Mucilaginibacter sp. KACC 22773]|uniref:hypothetical protein n=1 Tax=Mucilaginibacter sp. KACC 22773 TaxID=3025671 RepID=UPI002366C99A|nr:hypothetical protein [Mucilaginibacter sp. KACC 22773]WDF77024.1 hypothetical protein PQ469_24375 [Mucilaginibacter sp. KACC 22773]